MSMIFTVFTPAYNRESALVRLYESLSKQNFENFEWVVVDDGSVDGTRAVIENLSKNSRFPIKYKYQNNKGKYLAFNAGVEMASGDLFLTVDSDDELLPAALSDMYEVWKQIPQENRDLYTGVCALMVDSDRKVVGTKFPESPLDSNCHELMYKYSVSGDKIGFHRLDVLKKYPFPEYVGCNFAPESIVWARIGRKYLTRYSNIEAGIVHFDATNRITKTNVMGASDAVPYVDWYREMINLDSAYFKYDLKKGIKAIFNYSRFSAKSRIDIYDQIRGINSCKLKVLCSLIFPISFIYAKIK